jgi:hypothetical protein
MSIGRMDGGDMIATSRVVPGFDDQNFKSSASSLQYSPLFEVVGGVSGITPVSSFLIMSS